MKMTIDYFLLCESAVTDVSKRISLINIFDKIEYDKLPGKFPRSTIAFSVIAPENKYGNKIKIKITLSAPSEEVIFTMEGNGERVDDPDDPLLRSTINASTDVPGFLVKNTGEYTFNLYIEEELVAEKIIYIIAEGKI